LACCATAPARLSPELKAAAAEQGAAAAGVSLPALPKRCSTKTPHADPDIAGDVHGALKLEARQLDKANADKSSCAGLYDRLRAGLAKPEASKK